MGRDGIKGFKSHNFFRGIDWDNIRNRENNTITFEIDGFDDTRNFEEWSSEEEKDDSDDDEDKEETEKKMEAKDWVFMNYTFKRFESFTMKKAKESSKRPGISY